MIQRHDKSGCDCCMAVVSGLGAPRMHRRTVHACIRTPRAALTALVICRPAVHTFQTLSAQMLRTGQSAAGERSRAPAGAHSILRICMVQRPSRLLWRLDSCRGQVRTSVYTVPHSNVSDQILTRFC